MKRLLMAALAALVIIGSCAVGFAQVAKVWRYSPLRFGDDRANPPPITIYSGGPITFNWPSVERCAEMDTKEQISVESILYCRAALIARDTPCNDPSWTAIEDAAAEALPAQYDLFDTPKGPAWERWHAIQINRVALAARRCDLSS